MKNVMREAHKLTKEIKKEFPNVDYKAQLGICISYLNSNEEVEKDERIVKLKELAAEDKNYNKVWNKVEGYSKEIRGRKFNNEEIASFKYQAANIIALAIEILKEEVKKEVVKEVRTVNQVAPKGFIFARYEGYDYESGEKINVGDLITYVNGGWIRADNY